MSIVHVAKLANVSVATVSRVINNHPRVALATAESVRAAMLQLNYTPSDRRPGPKPSKVPGKRVADIGFFVFGTSATRATPAFESLLYGVSVAASQAGVNLIFSHVPDPSKLPERISADRLTGVLLHGELPSKAVRAQLEKLAVVWLMGNRSRPDFGDKVMPDGYRVGEIAARYLMGRGHRRLAFFNLDGAHSPLRVYGQAFVDAAVEGRATASVFEVTSETAAGYWRKHSRQAADTAIAQFRAAPGPPPTGFFIADDAQASILQPALQAAGVAIGPGQTEVISCNDEQSFLSALRPKPASIDIRPAAVGRRAVAQLLWRLEQPASVARLAVLIDPTLAPPADPVATAVQATEPARSAAS